MRRKLFIALVLLLTCSVLLLAACGRNRTENGDSSRNEPSQSGQVIGSATFDELVTLNIAATPGEVYFLNAAADRLRRELAETGVEFQMNLTPYTIQNQDDLDYYINSISTRFAAGQGYDIIMHHATNLPIYALIHGGYIADINPFIDRDPFSTREDYFTHILEAMEVNGGLYTFPLAFNFEFIGINANLPIEFLNRFAEYSAISISQLAAIYNDLIAAHPEFSELEMGFGLRHGAALQDFLGGGINWDASTLQQEAEPLTEFLQAMQVFSGNNRHGTFFTSDIFTNPRSGEMMGMLAERFVFSSHRFNLDPINAMLPFLEPYFVHYIPLVSEDGHLAVWDATANMYSISATADGDLAWAFLRHLVAARSESFRGGLTMEIPITRELFQPHMEIALRNALDSPAIMPFSGQGNRGAEDMIIETEIHRLTRYLTLPVSSLTTRILLPTDVLTPAFTSLLYDETPAATTADNLIASVTAWLAQEHTLDADSEAVEQLEAQAQAEAEIDGQPVRTISILAADAYANIIRQAAEDMNNAWIAQGSPYRFELNLTTYSWQEAENMQVRIQAMMMAGFGYDILFADWFMPYRTFAESGLLADVYTLIDQHPYTSRDDFYTNVLEAFEVNGGLYGFPLSFGFEWVGINADLPQAFINRFAQYDRISIGSKMAIYSDLLAEHGHEFGHLLIGCQNQIGHPAVALPYVMGSFIDFESRTANFTDLRFISFLEDFRDTFDGGLGFEDGVSMRGTSPFEREDTLRIFADDFVFWHDVTGLNPINALFTPVNPIFAHQIPVSDEYGRLRIPITGGGSGAPTWATLFFPLAGDSELAWEFTQHLISSFVNPRGRAALSQWGIESHFGRASFAVPIKREYFDFHMERVTGFALEHYALHQDFVNIPNNRDQAITDAINRLAQFINEPMVIPPTFPDSINQQNINDIENFKRGIITAQSAAQNIQNRVALWLIE